MNCSRTFLFIIYKRNLPARILFEFHLCKCFSNTQISQSFSTIVCLDQILSIFELLPNESNLVKLLDQSWTWLCAFLKLIYPATTMIWLVYSIRYLIHTTDVWSKGKGAKKKHNWKCDFFFETTTFFLFFVKTINHFTWLIIVICSLERFFSYATESCVIISIFFLQMHVIG